MESLGEYLKSQREARNITLDQVASDTRIRKNLLAAIEHDQYELLPAKVFTQGFLKTYACYLGVDEDEVARRYQEVLESLEGEAEGKKAAKEVRKPGSRALRILLVLAILIIAAALWFMLIPLGEKTTFIEEQGQPQSTSVSIAPPASVGVPLPEVKTPEEFAGGEERGGSPEQRTESTAVNEAKEADPEQMVLRVVCEEITWIKLQLDGRDSFEVLIKPGETLKVSAKEKFNLRIGNGGGVELFLDDTPLGKPGKPREVVDLSLPE